MAVSGKWTLGQEVLFDKELRRINEVEYDDPPQGYYRRGRVFNRWREYDFRHYTLRPLKDDEPARGILVRLTQRRDTEVVKGYEGEGNCGIVLKSHRVALVAVDLRSDLLVVPLENLRPVVGEDSEVLAEQAGS